MLCDPSSELVPEAMAGVEVVGDVSELLKVIAVLKLAIVLRDVDDELKEVTSALELKLLVVSGEAVADVLEDIGLVREAVLG